ncbi:MAG TPA: holin family protein [Paracoccaceae bacterium]|nr:holin family protein [Paracoccaceae bacterium]
MGLTGGLIGRALGGPAAVTALGDAARGVAEVFTPSATRRMELSAEAQMAALRQLGEEYGHPSLGWFDRLVNGLNRLPRPMLAFGTLGLFVYAMVDPVQFAQRMVGLNAVPEPLWWLLGAVVAFYFGARETHYFRHRTPPSPAAPLRPDDTNPALDDWRGTD